MSAVRAWSAMAERADGAVRWFGHCSHSMELSLWLQEISLVTGGGAVGDGGAAVCEQPPRRSVDSRAMSLRTDVDAALAGGR